MAQSFLETPISPSSNSTGALAYPPTTLAQLKSQILLVGQSLSFVLPRDKNQITAYNLPENSNFDPVTGKFWFTPNSAQAGNVYQISFRAMSADGIESLTRLDVAVTIDGAPHVNLISPDPGSRLTTDKPILIAWSVPQIESIANYQIRLSTDGGASYPILIADLPGSANQFQWLIPRNIPESNRSSIRFMVKVADSENRAGLDYSRQDLHIRFGSPQR